MCLCYINQEIGTETDETKKESLDGKQEYSSNFVAVGCLKGAIQIWDLDVLGKIYFPTGFPRGSSLDGWKSKESMPLYLSR